MFHLLFSNISIQYSYTYVGRRYSKFKFIKRVVSQSTPQRAYNTPAMVYTDVRYTIFPRIVSPLSSFRSNYSIHEVKNCHNAETVSKFPHFLPSKKNSFHGNYSRKYGMCNMHTTSVTLATTRSSLYFQACNL